MEIKTYTAEELKAMTAEEREKLKADYDTAKSNVEAVLSDIKQVAQSEVKTWAEQFRETHGVSVEVAVVVGGYIVWQVVSAVARALGAI